MNFSDSRRTSLLLSITLAPIALFFAVSAHAAAPRISGTPASAVTVGQAYNFQPTGSDADGNKLTFSIANQPGWASFSPSTGRLYGTPYSNHIGTYGAVVITVSDGASKVSLPSFSVVVKANANKSPSLSGTPLATATVGKAYSFQPMGKDPEGKTLSWSIRNKPTWANFSTTTGLLSGTPTVAGTFASILIVATDGVSSTSLTTFRIVASGTPAPANAAPVMTGAPSTTAIAGSVYSFTPKASDANGDALTFSIQNKPVWATFSTSSGQLLGTPSSAGTTAGIVIKVSDGKSETALAAFSLVVSAAATAAPGTSTVSWQPPTQNTDGSALTTLSGYRIYYGTSAQSLTNTITIDNAGLTRYLVEGMTQGAWYFAVTALTRDGAESENSVTVVASVL
jgi:hypothetical protein